jgi:hypothetical protein
MDGGGNPQDFRPMGADERWSRYLGLASIADNVVAVRT